MAQNDSWAYAPHDIDAMTADNLRASLHGRLTTATRGGWSPADLARVVTRQLSARHVPLLAALLNAAMAAVDARTVSAAWRAEVEALGRVAPPPLTSRKGYELGVALLRLLGTLPRIPALTPPPGKGDQRLDVTATNPAEAKVLAKVRALLAKAESTDFPDEAEALSAKAQELISRHSLDRLAAQAEAPDQRAGAAEPVARRLWLDAPYVLAKGMLVGAVARANRCRAVIDDRLGFVCLVGAAEDLDAVELLATSLLVQADVALLRAGRGRAGSESRSRSYRRAFLMAYAQRILERLTEVDATQVGAAGSALVPVIREHEARVEAKTNELFPRLTSRPATFSNRNGWAEGRAAADRAELGSPGQLAG